MNIHYKYHILSFALMLCCLISMALAGHFAAPDEMDRWTSLSIISLLGAILFSMITIVLLIIILIVKIRNRASPL